MKKNYLSLAKERLDLDAYEDHKELLDEKKDERKELKKEVKKLQNDFKKIIA